MLLKSTHIHFGTQVSSNVVNFENFERASNHGKSSQNRT